jgi:hypothetical protein
MRPYPEWLRILSWAYLSLSFLCVAIIIIDELHRPQEMMISRWRRHFPLSREVEPVQPKNVAGSILRRTPQGKCTCIAKTSVRSTVIEVVVAETG